jgi:hypothetical protein
MNDIEDRLNRYRPSGPPKELRARVVETRREVPSPRSRVLWWLPAMSAAAATLLFALLAGRARGDVVRRMAGIDAQQAEAVTALTAALGGGDLARAEAERVVSETAASSQPRAEDAVNPAGEGDHRD